MTPLGIRVGTLSAQYFCSPAVSKSSADGWVDGTDGDGGVGGVGGEVGGEVGEPAAERDVLVRCQILVADDHHPVLEPDPPDGVDVHLAQRCRKVEPDQLGAQPVG